jgi:hypothetical protein
MNLAWVDDAANIALRTTKATQPTQPKQGTQPMNKANNVMNKIAVTTSDKILKGCGSHTVSGGVFRNKEKFEGPLKFMNHEGKPLPADSSRVGEFPNVNL